MRHIFQRPRTQKQAAPSERKSERGVALIIVLGFLGLMVMMAVAFMVQARVERMVADATLEGLRARQMVQTGVAAAIQDYMNYIKASGSQSKTIGGMFLSGDLTVHTRYHYSGERYGSTNLWYGEAFDWLPSNVVENADIDLDDVQDMEWIWVREVPGERSPILGRYAYTCFNLSGEVDANLLGRYFGDEPEGYGTQTNRNNVRKMVMQGIHPSSPSMDTQKQLNLALAQQAWKGFDTPVAVNKLLDGKVNTGDDTDKDRWKGVDIYEDKFGDRKPPHVGILTDHLSCYSYAALHRGGGTDEKKQCTVNNITSNGRFKSLVSDMHGNRDDVEYALEDYTNRFADVMASDYRPSHPSLTDYPSVLPVPMFNEIKVEVELKSEDGKLHVTIEPEFWCPFPQQDKPKNFTLKPLETMAGGMTQSGSGDVWLYGAVIASNGPVKEATLSFESVAPLEHPVEPPEDCSQPWSPGKFEYVLKIEGIDKGDGTTLAVRGIQLRGIKFQTPWELLYGTKAVDATPKDLSFMFNGSSGNILPDKPAVVKFLEVSDPRLNHDANLWSASDGTMGDKNSCLDAAKNAAKAKMGYESGKYMYCRNKPMETPAELGYIPIYDGSTPWMTLDIFSENGIGLMNTLVCPTNVWDTIDEYDVFYTNGTINPYTRDIAVLNGAFYGLDIREVPNMPGKPNGTTEIFGAERTKELTKELIKDEDPDKNAFDKDGPGGWTRVLRDKRFNLNKNERIALAHNTWGLFNESDNLFLVFVVAQSITEGPKTSDNDTGDWDKDGDMITGERWAVALCWMDTSKEGASDDLTQEMDIIMFKYLNE